MIFIEIKDIVPKNMMLFLFLWENIKMDLNESLFSRLNGKWRNRWVIWFTNGTNSGWICSPFHNRTVTPASSMASLDFITRKMVQKSHFIARNGSGLPWPFALNGLGWEYFWTTKTGPGRESCNKMYSRFINSFNTRCHWDTQRKISFRSV